MRFNLLVYLRLECVIAAMSSISCMLVVNWLVTVCVENLMSCIPLSSFSLHLWGPESIWCCQSTAERFGKARGHPGKTRTGVHGDGGGWGGLKRGEEGLHSRKKRFVCCTTFLLLTCSEESKQSMCFNSYIFWQIFYFTFFLYLSLIFTIWLKKPCPSWSQFVLNTLVLVRVH